MARQLARDYGANLVITARRLERLEQLKTELESYNVEIHCIKADLANRQEVEKVLNEAKQDRSIYAAILNAGITHFGPFEELSIEQFDKMLAINISSVVQMTTDMIPYLEKQNQNGGILIIASMAGVTPVPYQTAYSATKSFIVSFANAISAEIAHRPVSITTFIPGGIQTEMTSTDRFKPLGEWLEPVDTCARNGLRAFAARKYMLSSGLLNRLGASVLSMLPRKFVTRQLASTYKKAIDSTDNKQLLGS